MSKVNKILIFAMIVVSLSSTLNPCHAQSAEQLIPFEKLPVKQRKEIWRVTKQFSVRSKLKDRTVDCRSSTLFYLLHRLPLASKLVRQLKIGNYKIEAIKSKAKSTKKQFSIDDTNGAFANCEIAYQDQGRIILIARGFVDAPLIPKVYGTGVIIIRTKNLAKQKVRVDCRIYFKLDNKALHSASKAFRKTLGKILDKRFSSFVDCAATLAQEIEANPKRVFQALEQSKISAEQVADFKRRFSTY